MIRRPPRSTLFPYTTLFRSDLESPRTEQLSGGYIVALTGDLALAVDYVNGRGRHLIRRIDTNAPASIPEGTTRDRKSTRLNSSHANISYAVFCLKKKKIIVV